MSTDTSKEYIELVECPEIQDVCDDSNCSEYMLGKRKEGKHDITYLPGIRWYMEHIPEFERYRWLFQHDDPVYRDSWVMHYVYTYKAEGQVIGKTWEQCFCKMYLKEVHGK